MGRRTRSAAAVGFSADGHRSHQLTDRDIEAADLVVAMAGEHVAFVRRGTPPAAAKTASIKRLCRDLADGPEPLADRVRPRVGRPSRRGVGGRRGPGRGGGRAPMWPAPRSWPTSAPNCAPAPLSGPDRERPPGRTGLRRPVVSESWGWRSEMSAQAAHTSSGMTPARIRAPKTMQPRQIANADSRKAAAASRAATTQVAVARPNPNHRTSAVEEKATPMAWANRLGGPATSFGAPGQPGGHHPGGQLAQGAERRAGQHPGPEPVGQRDQDPRLPEGDGGDRHDHHPGGHRPGRVLVDRVGEAEHPDSLPADRVFTRAVSRRPRPALSGGQETAPLEEVEPVQAGEPVDPAVDALGHGLPSLSPKR